MLYRATLSKLGCYWWCATKDWCCAIHFLLFPFYVNWDSIFCIKKTSVWSAVFCAREWWCLCSVLWWWCSMCKRCLLTFSRNMMTRSWKAEFEVRFYSSPLFPLSFLIHVIVARHIIFCQNLDRPHQFNTTRARWYTTVSHPPSTTDRLFLTSPPSKHSNYSSITTQTEQ